MHCDREPLSKLQRALVASIPPGKVAHSDLDFPRGQVCIAYPSLVFWSSLP